MPEREHDAARLLQTLSDRGAMQRLGIDDQWIQRCELLVAEFRRLDQRFRDLEAELNRSAPSSSQDTIVI